MPPVTDHSPAERLREILAVNRGIAFLKEYDEKLKKTAEHDQSNRADYLQGLFADIHRKLYRDTQPMKERSQALGKNAEARAKVREDLVYLAESLFDSNGFVKGFDHPMTQEEYKTSYLDRLSENLAEFYRRMQEAMPFEYGNEQALNMFVDCVGRLLNKKGMDFIDVDFRRLDHDDLAILNDPKANGKLKQVFAHALDASRTPVLQNKPDEFGRLDDNRVFIGGLPFLGYTDEASGTKYLVTVNGGLVKQADVEAPLQEHLLHSGKMVMEFAVKPERFINDEMQELGKQTMIDGYAIKDGKAPLVCLDANPLSGLREEHHRHLLAFLSKRFGEKVPLFALADKSVAHEAIDAADESQKHIIRLAAEHVRHITHQLDSQINAVFASKHPVENPTFVMSMGGGGSGKTAAEETVRAASGENYVVASLDKFRSCSHIYSVLRAAHHHSDDYVTVQPLASTMRDWVTERARAKHYNILYDGTGITFKPRYSDKVREFKKEGFKTIVACVDTMLNIPKGREAEFTTDAITRIRGRAQAGADKRMLPYIVVLSKHRNVMESFLDAVNDGNVDKAAMFCNDGKPGEHYLLAETFSGKKHGDKPDLGNWIRNNESSVLNMLAHSYSHDHPEVSAGKVLVTLMDRIPKLGSHNTSTIDTWVNGKPRSLGIMNIRRFVDVAEKVLFNPHASGTSNLLEAHRDLSFALPQYGNKSPDVPAHVIAQQPAEALHAQRSAQITL